MLGLRLRWAVSWRALAYSVEIFSSSQLGACHSVTPRACHSLPNQRKGPASSVQQGIL